MAVIVLLSGGIDSLVVAETYRRAGELAGCVFVDYGHPAVRKESSKAFNYCDEHQIRLEVPHARDVDLGDMGSMVAARVVPARNMLLIAHAANWAPKMGADTIAIGCNRMDHTFYPDCRTSFINGMKMALANGYGLRLEAPLLLWDKTQIVAKARALGLSREQVWSCYLGAKQECGDCPSCLESARAWGDLV